MGGAEIAIGLLALLAVLDMAFLLFRGSLLRAGQTQGLEKQIKEIREQMGEWQQKCADREPELHAANEKVEEALASLRKASSALAEKQTPVDLLIHRLGGPPGTMFRGGISKNLQQPDANQTLLWSCRHVVDVWADDAESARALALRTFPDHAGYVVSQLYPMETVTLRSPPAPSSSGSAPDALEGG